ncbi:hypothetical protein PBY51_004430 [Eleginops maclovinus]|uniref:Uncharacterized protein n=1 Tax=Eleginops maclovinus TaxID=56733 RepID=A0AAN8AX58_ELEMC|nr:hypothetical protein PBY51_004430 [Eleginops maclovinus]
MLLVVGEWRSFPFRWVAMFRNSSVAALEHIIVVNQCIEILLRVALAFTNSLAIYLSILLKLNAFLRLGLAGVLDGRDQHGRSSCSTWASSKTFSNTSCCLCSGGGSAVLWLKSALHAVPALCRRSRSVSMTLLALAPQRSNLRPSAIMALCGCIKSLLTGYSAKVL